MRHIGTHNLREPVILLGFKPDDNMVSYLRVSTLSDKEQEWLREAIFKHHKSQTLMSQLIHETSRQTGANAGEYFYRRSETCPLRDITMSDRDQCVEWTRGVSNYDPKVPAHAFIDTLKGGAPSQAQAQNQRKVPAPVAEEYEADASPLAEPALSESYYGNMVETLAPPAPPMAAVPAPPSPVPMMSLVSAAPKGSSLDGDAIPGVNAAEIAQLVEQNHELFGQVKSLKNTVKELTTAVRTLTRAKKKEGFEVEVLPKLDSDSE